jgi:TRAP-type C4-dicarboxylate transport system substrate-binding protein
MRGRTSSRRLAVQAIGLLSSLAVIASGCSASSDPGDKAGGVGEPAVLRIAGGGAPYRPALDEFIQRVGEVSGGQLRIDVVASPPGSELDAIAYVAAGKSELTAVGYRGFDGLGAGFRALLAPMLVDSAALEDAVLRSNIASTILADADAVGVVGVAIVPGRGPMKPFATQHPLVSLADWHGITFETYSSESQAAAVRALGGFATDASSPARDDGLKSGAIQGFSTGILAYTVNASEKLAPYVTTNVNLWPGMQVLIGNAAAIGRLSEKDRSWLRDAARDVLGSSMVREDDAQLAVLCKAGAQLSSASDAEIAALRAAVAPVYSELEQNAETKSIIDRITALKQSTPANAPPAIPAGCGPKATGKPETNALNGTWTTAHLTESEFVKAFLAAGFSEEDSHQAFRGMGTGAASYGTISVVFDHGDFTEFQAGDGGTPVVENRAVYVDDGDGTVRLTTDGTEIYSYQIQGDRLRLHLESATCPGGCGPPIGPTLYGSFPFTGSN